MCLIRACSDLKEDKHPLLGGSKKRKKPEQFQKIFNPEASHKVRLKYTLSVHQQGLGWQPAVWTGSGLTRTKANSTLFVTNIPREVTVADVSALPVCAQHQQVVLSQMEKIFRPFQGFLVVRQ